jgi:hypothetical protein
MKPKGGRAGIVVDRARGGGGLDVGTSERQREHGKEELD